MKKEHLNLWLKDGLITDSALLGILIGLKGLWEEGIEARLMVDPTDETDHCTILIGEDEDRVHCGTSQLSIEYLNFERAEKILPIYLDCINTFRRAMMSAEWEGKGKFRKNDWINVNQPLFYPYVETAERTEYLFKVKARHRDLAPVLAELGILADKDSRTFAATRDFADCLNSCFIGETICEPDDEEGTFASMYDAAKKSDAPV